MDMWPQVSIDTEQDLTMCFACGENNPIGLKLSFEWDGTTARAEFTPGRYHQGWPGVVHGGIISCLLDEAMTYVLYFQDMRCITAKMGIRIRRPIPVGAPLIITASVTKNSKRLVETEGAISSPDGTIMAEGTATMFVLQTKE